MITLNSLTNPTRSYKRRRRCGRGPGSKLGKTCGRGEKGAGSRAGYKRRLGYEGGQMRLYMKLPSRGFNNARFRKAYDAVNLIQIQAMFQDGDTVNADTLFERGLIGTTSYGVKILGEGELTKKVSLDVDLISAGAREKLTKAKIPFIERARAAE